MEWVVKYRVVVEADNERQALTKGNNRVKKRPSEYWQSLYCRESTGEGL